MLEILKRGRDESGYVAVKAEFEAEGTRIDELLRLNELTRRADLKLGLKIGGCEAIHDLLQSKLLGADYVIAPMIESPYALKKFIDAKNKAYSIEEREDTEFLFNLETAMGFANLNEMISVAKNEDGVNGVVFGRVDFTSSLGLAIDKANSAEVAQYCLATANASLDAGLDFVLGGGIGIDSLQILKGIHSVHLTRFETRKIIFDGKCLEGENNRDGLLQAVHFEIQWLLNKREYYGTIEREDAKRIDMLESRWKVLSGA
jgi:hypothetical protein